MQTQKQIQVRSFTTINSGIVNVLKNDVSVIDPITTRLAGKPLTSLPELKYKAIWETWTQKLSEHI